MSEISAKSIIDEAFLISGVTGIGDVNSTTGAESENALLVLNSLIDTWKIDKLLQFDTLLVEANVTDDEITIGPSGSITAQRPAKILDAYTRQTGSGNNLDTPLQIIEYMAYDSIRLKDTQTTVPIYLYYEPHSPDGTIHLWPKPQGTIKLFVRYMSQLSEYSTINDVMELPPGYILALQYNVAAFLCVKYGLNRPDIARLADSTLATIQRQNVRINTLALDRRMPVGKRIFGSWSINQGNYY